MNDALYEFNKRDTTIYERITEFQAAVEQLARERGLNIDRFEVYDRSTQVAMRADFTATSMFLRERHPEYRRNRTQPYTGDTIRLEEGRHEAL
jgi:hypothetical protein